MTPAAELKVRQAVEALVEAIVEAVSDQQPDPNTAPRLYGAEEAAAQLGIGRTAVFAEIAAGRLRSVTVGRRRLIPASALVEFIRDRETA